ncbi:IS110 family transposase [Halomonas sp.]|uniref:IS110 family transposase n=1 Tax=Halomonas sp. TaxID=1486246 RepID=UPI000EC38D7C|nr:IS110 family transposase [Halomonas sp.]HCR98450.1 IS110 family transposase [Halomonas sp.]
MNISRVGVDIAKSVFHVHGVDRHEQPQWRGKYTRAKWLDAVCRRVPQGAIIGMEACATAHYWARQLQARGYQVKLVAAQFVKPYVKTNKNDRADAEAICEALGRPTMRFVAIKSVEQQDAQATHRIREELISQRTAKANQIRGLVGEYGLIAPTGIQQLRRALPLWLEDASNGLSDHFRRLLAELANDLRYLDDRVEQLTTAIEKHANTDPVARRLMTLRGIGPITASALAGVLGDGTIYQRGRDFAASLGLTPRQHSTGGRERLLGISKRGNGYLRKLLVHGARSVLRYAVTQEDGLSQWIKRLAMRKHRNVAIVALANKTARMAWAITRHQVPYDPELAAAA